MSIAVRLTSADHGGRVPDRVLRGDFVDIGPEVVKVSSGPAHERSSTTVIYEYGYWHISGDDVPYTAIDAYAAEPDD